MITEEKDALVMSIKNARNKIRKEVEEKLFKECNEAQAIGKYLCEGLWLTPQDIDKLYKKLKRRDKVVLIEISIFFTLAGLVSYGLYFFMVKFLLPR